jgi:hypothetical protein
MLHVLYFRFAVYSQLGKYVGPNFFPAGNAYAEQLSFWAAYAVAFVVRPLGAILFGEQLLLVALPQHTIDSSLPMSRTAKLLKSAA